MFLHTHWHIASGLNGDLIVALPVISTYPNNNGNLTIAEGSNVTLRCEVTGGGTLIYRWKRASGSLPRNINAKNEQNLTIYNIMVRNSGEYYCEVDNGEKKVSSMSVQVTARSEFLQL